MYLIRTDTMESKKLTEYRVMCQNLIQERGLILCCWPDMKQVNIENLLPEDLGLKTEEWITPPLEKGMNTYIDSTTPSDAVIGIYGIGVEGMNPGTVAIGVLIGGLAHVYRIHIQQLYVDLALIVEVAKVKGGFQDIYGKYRMEGYFNEPFIIDPAKRITVYTYSRGTRQFGDRLILLGFIGRWAKRV